MHEQAALSRVCRAISALESGMQPLLGLSRICTVDRTNMSSDLARYPVLAMMKTLASYLADRPEDQLQEMLSGIKQKRERLQEEDKNLAFEEQLVEQAISRKARRTGAAGGGRVTREQVFEIVSTGVGHRFKAPEALAAMNEHGINMAPESLRQHLRRLVKDGRFGREEDYYVNSKAPEEPPGASNGNRQATQTSPEASGIATGEEREIGIHHGSPQGAG